MLIDSRNTGLFTEIKKVTEMLIGSRNTGLFTEIKKSHRYD